MEEHSETMFGVWLTGHGGFEKLEVRNDIPIPQPDPYDVLIQVSAAGVNNTDINTRTAWYSKQAGTIEDASWGGRRFNFPAFKGQTCVAGLLLPGKG